MYYSPLAEVDSTPPHDSTTTIDLTGSTSHIQSDRNDHLCRICKTQLIKKQPTHHTPIECLSQRCKFLELEIVQLKDRDTKSCLQIKQLENKIIVLEDAIKGLTAPKEQLAAPFTFGGTGYKHRRQMKKSNSGSVLLSKSNINYDNILQSKRPNSRERPGLFGSLGASSQQRSIIN